MSTTWTLGRDIRPTDVVFVTYSNLCTPNVSQDDWGDRCAVINVLPCRSHEDCRVAILPDGLDGYEYAHIADNANYYAEKG